MKFNLFNSGLLLASTLIITSCTNEEILDVNNSASDARLISYNSLASYSTKAQESDLYNSTNIPDSFYVWATIGDESTTTPDVYFSKDLVSKNSTDETWTGKGTQYWPADASSVLNFYAIAGTELDKDATFNEEKNALSLEYTVSADATTHKDVLYASAKGKTRNLAMEALQEDQYIPLNFSHALSQIEIRADVTNENLRAEVQSITIHNVYGNGTFSFPVEEGSGWTLDSENSDSRTSYTTTFGNGSSVSLSKADGITSADELLLLIPEKYYTEGYVWTKGDATNLNEKVYFSVNCKIYQKMAETEEVNGETVNKEVCIWEGSEDKQILLAVEQIDWVKGYKYTYTFVFGTIFGGNDSENPENPALVPIQYVVNCDNWQVSEPEDNVIGVMND